MKQFKKTLMIAGSAVLLAGAMTFFTWAEEAVTEADEAVEEITEAETEFVSSIVELGERPTFSALDYVTLGEYTDLPVEVEPISVSEEEIDASLAGEIASHDAYDVFTEGTVAVGDIANIDYEGKKDDVAFDGGTAQGYDLEIGSGTFIEGFEEGLVGVAVGDTVDLPLTFPENYHSEELAGAEVIFTVTVNSVKRMPEITDALIGTISDGAYSTIDGYRAYLEQELLKAAEENRVSEITTELMTQLYNTCTVNDYPEDLLTYSVTEMNNYYANYAENYYGISLEDFISGMFGMTIDDYNAEAVEIVKESLDQELILTAIAEQEGLADIDDEAYQAGCEEYASRLGYPSTEEFQADYDKEKVLASMRMDAAIQYVRDNAYISEPETEGLTEAVTE